MSDNVDFKAIKHKAEKDIYQDGIEWFQLSAGFGLFALFEGMADSQWYGLFICCSIPLLLLIFFIIDGIRKRFTYPRVGFVKFRSRNIFLEFPLLMVFMIIIGFGSVMLKYWLNFGIVFSALIMLSLYLVIYVTWKSLRFRDFVGFVYVVWYLISGVIAVIFFLRGVDVASLIFMWGLFGISFLVGAIKFRRFLQNNPLPVVEV